MRQKQIISSPLIGEEMIKITHESGLTVYISKKDFGMSYAVFGTRYGSIENTFTVDGERTDVPHGIAHFLEHKMFESEDGRDGFEKFGKYGADANAYTSFDRTAYIFSCTENFYESLEVLLRMVTTPHFTEKNVEKEKGIIRQEIKMCEDRTSYRRYYNLLKALYGNLPIAIPVAGTVESIGKITPELLYKCYNAFYRMSNMALCVCGNLDEDSVMEIVDRVIGNRSVGTVLPEYPADDLEAASGFISDEMDISKPIGAIGLKIPLNVKNEVLDILCNAVFGESEEFYSSLYEKRMVNHYDIGCDCVRNAKTMIIEFDSDSPKKVYEGFLKHIEKIRIDGVDVEAFERAKKTEYAETLRKYDSSISVAEAVFDGFIDGNDFIGLAERYSAVTADDVNQLAKQIFKKESTALSVICPKGYIEAEKD